MSSGPAPHEVHVFFRDTASATAPVVQAARDTLSADERARADRFHFTEDRRDYTLAHDLLRRCLSHYRPVAPVAWEFHTEPAGKPFLAGNGSLSFNLSHTRGLVACAIGPGMAIGVDVEEAARVIDAAAIAERYFSPSEVASLTRCAGPAHRLRFLELWTLKESFIKAVGIGLSQPLNSMSFGLEEEGAIAFEPPAGFTPSEWHFALYEPPGSARIAVAAHASAAPTFVTRGSCPGGPATAARELRPSRVTRIARGPH
jgi:4'-phosphopantetheinyl transferase